MKESLTQYMLRKRKEIIGNKNISTLELDLLMAQWADEFYNDGSKHLVLGNKVIISK